MFEGVVHISDLTSSSGPFFTVAWGQCMNITQYIIAMQWLDGELWKKAVNCISLNIYTSLS